MRNNWYYTLLILLLPVACIAPKPTVKQPSVNLSSTYNPTSSRLHPAYTIYHNSPSSSLLLIKIFPSELLYSGIIEPNKILGQVKLTYQLLDITDPLTPAKADSGGFTYNFARENADKRFITQLSLKTQPGNRYQLAVIARDMIRRVENLTYLYIDRSSDLSEQNFMITAVEEKSPVFKPYVVGNATLRIDFNNTETDSIYVLYYGKDLPMPNPSFSGNHDKEFLQKPDSIWIMPLSKANHYQFNYEGVYRLKADSSTEEGLTLMNFGEHFPKVEEVKHLIEPLAYLATSTEYEALKKATNQKLAVDDFWLKKAGEIEKARELIRVYYNRVYFANYYFTSLKPGWKTDRGMIFIIYGPPQSVKVTPTQERWVYYKSNFTTTVTFVFEHKPTAYSLDNYILQRSDSYDTYWRTAIDSWRKGRIYLIE